MLTDLALFATDLLSRELWPSHALLTPPSVETVTPNEPRTLVLALIGAATMSVYLAIRGIRRASSVAAPDVQPGLAEAAQARREAAEQRPTRGAA
jgi:hypothetical protein